MKMWRQQACSKARFDECSQIGYIEALWKRTWHHSYLNPKVFSPSEWRKRIDSQDAFVQDVMSKPKLFVIGSQRDIE